MGILRNFSHSKTPQNQPKHPRVRILFRGWNQRKSFQIFLENSTFFFLFIAFYPWGKQGKKKEEKKRKFEVLGAENHSNEFKNELKISLKLILKQYK